ncbi:hypothetical protein JY96_00930 [Aquabacterium sp. NJ1]|nr:hypothetical protein JY96_00930 [Aquabacterium sp. NJ1]
MLVLLVTLSLTLVGPVSAAKAADDAIRCPDRPIRYAFFESPVLFEAGKGLEKDLFDEIRARSGCRFETIVMPRVRIWNEFEAGHLDMTTTVLRTPEREKTLWVLDYLQLRNYLLVRKSDANRLAALQDFDKPGNALRIGVVRGYKYGLEYDAMLKKLAANGRVDEVVRSDQLFRMLKAGRISAMIATPLNYLSALTRNGMVDQVTILDWGGPSAASPRGLGLSKQSFTEAEARKWQALLDNMRRDGTILRLIKRYMKQPEANAMMLQSRQ